MIVTSNSIHCSQRFDQHKLNYTISKIPSLPIKVRVNLVQGGGMLPLTTGDFYLTKKTINFCA